MKLKLYNSYRYKKYNVLIIMKMCFEKLIKQIIMKKMVEWRFKGTKKKSRLGPLIIG